jgi:hypothetical protein
MTLDQSMRVDCALTLKVALDEMRGRLFRGEDIDTGKVLQVSAELSKILPAQPEAEAEDPRRSA